MIRVGVLICKQLPLLCCEPMKKIHGWFIIFLGYVFGLLAIAILIVYLQDFMSIVTANPYVILMFISSLALNVIGAYVIHRCTE